MFNFIEKNEHVLREKENVDVKKTTSSFLE